MTVDNDINGSLLKIKRESLGWTLADMAARACLSTKQVRQLEEGGDNSFYSHAIKLTVAKKIALILNISEDELFYRSSLPETSVEQERTLEEAVLDSKHTVDQSPLTSASLLASTAEIKQDSKASKADVTENASSEKSVSFASILTRSQSPSDDLDALLADEDTVTSNSAESISEVKESSLGDVPAPVAVTTSTEASHSETFGLPSTPSPITLSSASSSLSEDQHSNEQSIWVKVILAVLVLIGALLIVSPKSFEGLGELIEGGFKKIDPPIETPIGTGTVASPIPPILDTTQNDTPVEAGKANALTGAPEANKTIPVTTSAAAPATLQSSGATAPLTPTPGAAPSGASLNSSAKPNVPGALQTQSTPLTTPPAQ